MPDIGFGEIMVIVVIALLVFGPDRLPKVAADAARTLRQVRRMAAQARQNLVDASGLDGDEDVSQAVRDLRELDPRRAMQGLSGEVVGSSGRSGSGSAGNGSASRRGSAGNGGAGNASGPGRGEVAPDGPAVAGSDDRSETVGAPDRSATSRPDLPGSASQPTGQPGRGSAGPVRAADRPAAPPVIDAAPVDPDWT